MRILYVGHYNDGSTSKMRGEYLKDILNASEFYHINIDIPLQGTNRLARSFGWRYRKGPLITNINNYIVSHTPRNDFELVWIDKGVFIKPSVLRYLRSCCKLLIHFTPDPAFMYHQSELFYNSIPDYDYCITTKSFEMNEYKKYGARNVLYCTQGYDPRVHKPYYSFSQKSGVVFIGHREPDREEIISKLLQKKICVKLAGINWEKFSGKHKLNPNLQYLGNGIFGAEYARVISESLLGLGFLSKIIPELHTTRTLEIPACGTALATERNEETQNLFNEDDVLFYSNHDELLYKIDNVYNDKEALKRITNQGMNRLRNGGYDYKSILERILKQIEL